mgnify:CR=1 FL=1
MLVAGIDACRAGWFAVMATRGRRLTITGHRVCATFTEAAAWASDAEAVAVDIPIGLADERRACDAAARKLLWPRAVCVFWAPPRAVLAARTYSELPVLGEQVLGQDPVLRRREGCPGFLCGILSIIRSKDSRTSRAPSFLPWSYTACSTSASRTPL